MMKLGYVRCCKSDNPPDCADCMHWGDHRTVFNTWHNKYCSEWHDCPRGKGKVRCVRVKE